MKHEKKADRLVRALLAMGCAELRTKSGKYRMFEHSAEVTALPSYYFIGKMGALRAGKCASKSVSLESAIPGLLAKWAPIDTETETAKQPKVRCACIIPGGIQCVLEMYHTGDHRYEPVAPFSTHLTQEAANV